MERRRHDVFFIPAVHLRNQHLDDGSAVEVDGETVRVWSVWDAAAPARRPAAVPVWEARLVRGELVASLGGAVL